MSEYDQGNPAGEVTRYLSYSQELYANQWSEGNAAALEAGGHYQWMASFVDGYHRVLEIGTGDGRGTAALVERGHRVLSLDENRYCLDRAEARLRGLGYLVERLQRGETVPVYDAENRGLAYTVRYPEISHRELSADGTTLVESNILTDASMWEVLRHGPRFDAIVCWLIGIHTAVHANVMLNRMPTVPEMYRIRVQNWAYELADAILRPGGILHVVDRLVDDRPDVLDDIRSGHEDQASVTTLLVDSVEARAYEEPQGATRVEVGNASESASVPYDIPRRLVSVLARKPG